MGERNSIFLQNDGIYLYSHWDPVGRLLAVVKSALIRGKSRWNDRTYLNRIIFSELIKDELMELTGYGLGNLLVDGGVPVKIDVDNRLVNGTSFEKFLD